MGFPRTPGSPRRRARGGCLLGVLSGSAARRPAGLLARIARPTRRIRGAKVLWRAARARFGEAEAPRAVSREAEIALVSRAWAGRRERSTRRSNARGARRSCEPVHARILESGACLTASRRSQQRSRLDVESLPAALRDSHGCRCRHRHAAAADEDGRTAIAGPDRPRGRGYPGIAGGGESARTLNAPQRADRAGGERSCWT